MSVYIYFVLLLPTEIKLALCPEKGNLNFARAFSEPAQSKWQIQFPPEPTYHRAFVFG